VNGSGDEVTSMTTPSVTLHSFDVPTMALVRLSAHLAGGSEAEIRLALSQSIGTIDPSWVEELILQTYLFAGFPRALNAAREWRRISGYPAPSADEGAEYDVGAWTTRGEETCEIVYGPFYERLRSNIRTLHPALDSWMIVEGYGKVLGRPQLDLARRELCVVVACAVARQDRQLHSHLHGALHAGVAPDVVSQALASIADLIDASDMLRYENLWTRVTGK
jgi:4-carboxymuconolactone decarboxylase